MQLGRIPAAKRRRSAETRRGGRSPTRCAFESRLRRLDSKGWSGPSSSVELGSDSHPMEFAPSGASRVLGISALARRCASSASPPLQPDFLPLALRAGRRQAHRRVQHPQPVHILVREAAGTGLGVLRVRRTAVLGTTRDRRKARRRGRHVRSVAAAAGQPVSRDLVPRLPHSSDPRQGVRVAIGDRVFPPRSARSRGRGAGEDSHLPGWTVLVAACARAWSLRGPGATRTRSRKALR